MRAVCLDQETIQEKRMKEITLQEAALAWAQGNRVEATPKSHDDWTLIARVGRKTNADEYSSAVFAMSEYRFRLAPEPPAKRYRPYTRAELCDRIGAVVEVKAGGFTAMIIGVPHETVHIGNSHYTFECLLRDYTWKDGTPCGVEVEA